MNRADAFRFTMRYAVLPVALLATLSGPASADDAIPIEPIIGDPPRVRRLEIVDAPDPIGNGITLHTKSSGSASAPAWWPNSVPHSSDVAVDPATGRTIVGWVEQVGGGNHLVLAEATENGWGAASRLGDAYEADPVPSMGFSPDGELVLAFVVASGAESRAFLRTAGPPDWTWSAPQPISLPGERVTSASLVHHEGRTHVAYARLDGPATSIVHATHDGTAWSREVVATSAYDGNVLPRIHSHAGVLWIDWVDAQAPTGAGELGWARRDAAGTWEPARYAGFDSPFHCEHHARPGIRLQAIAP